jgi:hypothetical protein
MTQKFEKNLLPNKYKDLQRLTIMQQPGGLKWWYCVESSHFNRKAQIVNIINGKSGENGR